MLLFCPFRLWINEFIIFTAKETELKIISSDPLNENPKLKELQDQILSYYKDNKDSLGIVFCKTRDMVQSLCDWMKETPELTWLNPNIAMGTGKSSNMKGGGQFIYTCFSMFTQKSLILHVFRPDQLDGPQHPLGRYCTILLSYESNWLSNESNTSCGVVTNLGCPQA